MSILILLSNESRILIILLVKLRIKILKDKLFSLILEINFKTRIFLGISEYLILFSVYQIDHAAQKPEGSPILYSFFLK